MGLGENIKQLRKNKGGIKLIGKNVAKFRTNMKLSQRELARRTGISGQMISKIEHNLTQPSLETLKKIAAALNVSLEELISTPNIKPYKSLSDYTTRELLEELARRRMDK